MTITSAETVACMGKIGLIAVVAALTLVGVGGWLQWVTASSQARLAAPAWDSIDRTQITMKANHLPVAKFVDYTSPLP
jgi:Flp pilus assembly protein CpaB